MKRRQTAATDIPQDVKVAVAQRDSVDGWPCCVLCYAPAPTGFPTAWSCCHYIPRSRGGLGIEENIFTSCPRCHRKYDQSEERGLIRLELRAYLKAHYPGWDERRLTYSKEDRS